MIKRCALGLLMAGGVWFSAAAYDWASKPTAELKADCIRFARENGYGDFADRIEKEANLTDWIDETVRFCEARLAESEGAEFTDPDRRRALLLLDYPLHVDNYATNTPPAVAEAFEKSILAYEKRAIARTLREVREAKVAPGSLRAWHVYNMSYILKGNAHTVLIDFTPYPHIREVVVMDDDRDIAPHGQPAFLDGAANAHARNHRRGDKGRGRIFQRQKRATRAIARNLGHLARNHQDRIGL